MAMGEKKTLETDELAVSAWKHKDFLYIFQGLSHTGQPWLGTSTYYSCQGRWLRWEGWFIWVHTCQHHPEKKKKNCRKYALLAWAIIKEASFLASKTKSYEVRHCLSLEVDRAWTQGPGRGRFFPNATDKVGGLFYMGWSETGVMRRSPSHGDPRLEGTRSAKVWGLVRKPVSLKHSDWEGEKGPPDSLCHHPFRGLAIRNSPGLNIFTLIFPSISPSIHLFHKHLWHQTVDSTASWRNCSPAEGGRPAAWTERLHSQGLERKKLATCVGPVGKDLNARPPSPGTRHHVERTGRLYAKHQEMLIHERKS